MKYMHQHFARGSAITLLVWLSAVAVHAQATSRMIPFSGVQTTLPGSTTQAITVQMFDEGGILITAEDHPAVPVDEAGRISFLFGSMTGGLNPDHFPSGSSRFVDVIDPATGASVLGAQIALNATAFALSPGPQGLPGERGLQGERGEQGPPGFVTLPFSGTVSSSSPALNVSNTGSGHGLVVAISGERAVWGQSMGLNGSGAVGVATNGSNARGVWGFSPTGFGVVADGFLVGLQGAATSSGAFSQGVRGVATATSGLTFGVWGESLSTSNGAVGVLGRSGTAGNTSGVWGETNSFAGAGGTFFNAADGDIIRGLNSARQQVFTVTNSGNVRSIGTLDGSTVFALSRIGIGILGSRLLTVRETSPSEHPIASAWTVYSSRRWKQNIQSIDRALEKVQALRGVSYEWTSNGRHDIGLIAEEVGKVIPEVVAFEENGIDASSVDYARLTALLVEAIKAQQSQIRDQQSQITELKTELQHLAARFAQTSSK